MTKGSFIELDRLWSMWLDWLVFCDCGFQSVCPLMEKDKRLMEASSWEWLTEWETGSCSDGQSHVQWIFNPIVCEWVGLHSLPVIYLGPNYGGGNEDNGDLLQKIPCIQCCIQCPWPCSRPPPTLTSTRDSWTLTGKSGSVSCFSPNQFIYADVISVWFLNSLWS